MRQCTEPHYQYNPSLGDGTPTYGSKPSGLANPDLKWETSGAYGIQEWIGYVGVEAIEGSYFNVVGLPVQRLYRELINFCKP